MSVALAHFSIGATIVILGLLLSRQYTRPEVPLYITLGGIWGMGPDIHWIIPDGYISDVVYAFHSTRVADLFAFHFTLDTHDPSDSVAVLAICFAIFVVAVTILSLAGYIRGQT